MRLNSIVGLWRPQRQRYALSQVEVRHSCDAREFTRSFNTRVTDLYDWIG